ncbi:lipopolysaccharide heptosyltransferase family protein [Dokdonia sinensis]|uniref:Lipopolysaccharide heptosyltransferase family protein n=1 Tax=Dokdonia sinensis TaxID=2479847 RepID=A0A3M0G0A3_9FLAO|nr:glycosyltransferase family 9 protein [Dokdonia sinensis]RMB57607.1 lipopolysaccharide heptosyltransferase family protein [Dokdonia sinensis]
MKFLIIQQKMIGDVLTSSILCESLKKRYPDSAVHYLVNSHTIPVLDNNPYIDKLILYTPTMEKNSADRKQLRQILKAEDYDAVMDVYSKIGSARIANATKAPKIIGYKKWYTRFMYTHVFRYNTVPETEAGLAVENRMMLLQPIAPDFPKEVKPKIYLREEEIAFAKAELKKYAVSTSKPIFMIGVLGSCPEKTYPLTYLAQVLDFIVLKTEATLLLNYIPNQKDDVEKLIAHCNSATRDHIKEDVYGKSLREFIALTNECTAYIGNEGGAANMAKAITIPTFSIFSPWITKAAWALYLNENNIAIHLADYKASLYKEKTLKEIRKRVHHYYEKLEPDLFRKELDEFLKKFIL